MKRVILIIWALLFLRCCGIYCIEIKECNKKRFIPGRIPDKYRWITTYAIYPDVSKAIDRNKYIGLIKEYYKYLVKYIKEDMSPDFSFVCKNILLVPHDRTGVDKDIAFLRYSLDKEDILISQTGGRNGKIYIFISSYKNILLSKEDVKELIKKFLKKKYVDIILSDRCVIDNGIICIYGDNIKIFAFGNGYMSIIISKILPSDPLPSRMPLPDGWFEWAKEIWNTRETTDDFCRRMRRRYEIEVSNKNKVCQDIKGRLIEEFESIYNGRGEYREYKARKKRLAELLDNYKKRKGIFKGMKEEDPEILKFLIRSYIHIGIKEKQVSNRRDIIEMIRGLLKVRMNSKDTIDTKKIKELVDKMIEGYRAYLDIEDNLDQNRKEIMRYIKDKNIPVKVRKDLIELVSMEPGIEIYNDLLDLLESEEWDYSIRRLCEIGIKRILNRVEIRKGEMRYKGEELQ